jgi:HJR/Mrr/RecB family endonuclease
MTVLEVPWNTLNENRLSASLRNNFQARTAQVVAELLELDGYTIELMNGTKDGGIDVVAIKGEGISGYYKTVWQAKKYNKTKVGLHHIRELADSVHELGASKGIIVTTS